jgi:hypothetical protein
MINSRIGEFGSFIAREYVTIQGSQIVDSQSLAKDKKNDPEYKPISRTKYTY